MVWVETMKLLLNKKYDLGINFRDYPEFEYYIKNKEIEKKVKSIRKLFNFSQAIDIKKFETLTDAEVYFGKKLPGWFIGASIDNTIFLLDFCKWHKGYGVKPAQVLLHEFVHTAVKHTNKCCPIWINEGLALNLSGQINDMISNNKLKIDKRIYDLHYDDPGFYIICGYSIYSLIKCYGVKRIIKRLSSIQNFEEDKIFNPKNVELANKKCGF